MLMIQVAVLTDDFFPMAHEESLVNTYCINHTVKFVHKCQKPLLTGQMLNQIWQSCV